MRLRAWLEAEGENGRQEIVLTVAEIVDGVDGRAAVAAEEAVAADADRAAVDAEGTAVVMVGRGTRNQPRIFTNSHGLLNG
jgi:hypothetical protein